MTKVTRITKHDKSNITNGGGEGARITEYDETKRGRDDDYRWSGGGDDMYIGIWKMMQNIEHDGEGIRDDEGCTSTTHCIGSSKS